MVGGAECHSEGHDRIFQHLLCDSGSWRPSLMGIDFNRIDEIDVDRLEADFSTKEVFAALSDLNRKKAPRPDGLSIAFWQFSWNFMNGGYGPF